MFDCSLVIVDFDENISSILFIDTVGSLSMLGILVVNCSIRVSSMGISTSSLSSSFDQRFRRPRDGTTGRLRDSTGSNVTNSSFTMSGEFRRSTDHFRVDCVNVRRLAVLAH